MKQMLLDTSWKRRVEHGGELSLRRRKGARPVSTREAIHVVMRSEVARGAWVLSAFHNKQKIQPLISEMAKRFGVKVYKYSVNSNHLHFVLRVYQRESLGKFLAALGGRIAQVVTGACKGNPLGRKFFDAIPWSRIVVWGKGFAIVKGYVEQNIQEAAGLIPYTPRKSKHVRKKRQS